MLGGSLYTVYCSQLFFPSLSLQYACSVLLGAGAAILWTAQVLGLGPVFRLILGLTNTSVNTPTRNVFITFYCDDKLYR